jgi:hypothetical protein
MMRRLVHIRSKFRRHNLDVLGSTISGMLSKNSGVRLPKFCSDLNQVSCHKPALLVTLG